jgi:hypothetical protein
MCFGRQGLTLELGTGAPTNAAPRGDEHISITGIASGRITVIAIVLLLKIDKLWTPRGRLYKRNNTKSATAALYEGIKDFHLESELKIESPWASPQMAPAMLGRFSPRRELDI